MPIISPTFLPLLPAPGVSGGPRSDVARVEDALRRGNRDPRLSDFLSRLARSPVEGDGNGKAPPGADGASEHGRGPGTPAVATFEDGAHAGSAPFLAQAIAQEQGPAPETPIDPFGRASQAYGRLGASSEAYVLAYPIKVDLTV